ncbi:MAG: LysR family transcriptional regulator [Thermoguttaceae bacterium]|jgi:DNA-binding transcriptional LysR family regulator
MNTETLRVFCDVVYYQSFSRGAKANNISQSAATQSIHRLEKQLGSRLIDRSRRPFILTPEGKICYDGFRELLETYDAVVSRVKSHSLEDSGVIRVAAIYSIGLHDMNKIMRDFIKARSFPAVRLELLHPEKVYKAVNSAAVDFGIVSYPSATPEVSVIPLLSEDMVVVTPPDHPLAQEKALKIEQLQDEDFVAYVRDMPIRREIDKIMRQKGMRVNIVTEYENIETIKQAIEVGLGVSILPLPTVEVEAERGLLGAIPLESPKMTRPIGVIHKRRKVFTPAMKEFIEALGGRVP